MNKIQIFNHKQFGEVRTMTNEKGETFFVGKDVAKALGYSNTRDALNKHVDSEDKGTVAIRDTAYETRAVVINESGLYSLILSSKLVVEYHPGEPISVALSRKAKISEMTGAKVLIPRSSTPVKSEEEPEEVALHEPTKRIENVTKGMKVW